MTMALSLRLWRLRHGMHVVVLAHEAASGGASHEPRELDHAIP
jgi:hypothetical protein